MDIQASSFHVVFFALAFIGVICGEKIVSKKILLFISVLLAIITFGIEYTFYVYVWWGSLIHALLIIAITFTPKGYHFLCDGWHEAHPEK